MNIKKLSLLLVIVSISLFTFNVSGAVGSGNNTKVADRIREASSLHGGFFVVLGGGSPTFISNLFAKNGCITHVVCSSEQETVRLQKYFRSKKLYGRITVEQVKGSKLPYANDIVNAMVITKMPSQLTLSEIVRCLVPNGMLMVANELPLLKVSGLQKKSSIKGFRVFRKPISPALDDWTHYLHNSTNNAVSSDSKIAPPHQLRWVAYPRWVRHHDHVNSFTAMVAGGGRIFYVIDDGMHASMVLPSHWKVVARDAFNGVLLWERPLKDWHPAMWPAKFGPAQLPRRIITDGKRLYMPLTETSPLSALDAVTGKLLKTYSGTKATEEVIQNGSTLYLIVNKSPLTFKDTSFTRLIQDTFGSSSWGKIPAYKSPNPEKQPFSDVTGMRSIMAVDSNSGKILWSHDSGYLQLTLAFSNGKIFFCDGKRIVALNAHNGKEIWKSRQVRNQSSVITAQFSANLVVSDNTVLFSGTENRLLKHRSKKHEQIIALDAETGKKLWNAPHPPSGYCSSEDLFVIDKKIWSSNVTLGLANGKYTERDIRTGKIAKEFRGNDGRHMPHHRCYRARATKKYFLMSRTGIEFVDKYTSNWDRNDWVRGTCLYGILPAYGLVYAPPHSCTCYVESKLNNFNAITSDPAPAAASAVSDPAKQLTIGPAYKQTGVNHPKTNPAEEWPVYRHDSERTGFTPMKVASDVALAWKTKLSDYKLTAPVVSGNRIFIASPKENTLFALDASSGRKLWEFVAGGPIDSPPSIWRGSAVFGAADGVLYCVDTASGLLRWKYRVVPVDRRIISFDALESQWPLHGSPLIINGAAYCVSGRLMFLDGGIRFIKVDIKSGKLLFEKIMTRINPKTGKRVDANVRWPKLPVAVPDILSYDGKYIYMLRQAFTLDGKRVRESIKTNHLFCPTGFVASSVWWHRSYWLYGYQFGYGVGYKKPAYSNPSGRILVMDKQNIFGFSAYPRHMYNGWSTSWWKYRLFKSKKHPEIISLKSEFAPLCYLRSRKKVRKKWPKYDWATEEPILARGMVLCNKTLFVAGPPSIMDERKVMAAPDAPRNKTMAAKQESAWQGKLGGVLLAMDADTGKVLSEYKSDFIPVWDALIAAYGKLFIATTDGSVVCMKPTKEQK